MGCDVVETHFIEMECNKDKANVAILVKKNIDLEAYGFLKELCNPDLPSRIKCKVLIDML